MPVWKRNWFVGVVVACVACGPKKAPPVAVPMMEVATVRGAEQLPLKAFLVPTRDELPDGALERCAEDGEVDDLGLDLAMIVAIPGQPLTFAGEEVGQIDADGFLVTEDPESAEIPALRDALEAQLARTEAAVEADCAPWALPERPWKRLLLLLDAKLPAETLSLLQRTAGIAGYPELALLVEDPEAIPRPWPDPRRPAELAIGVATTREGFDLRQLRGSGTRDLPCPSSTCSKVDDYPLDALSEAIQQLAADKEHAYELIVMLDDVAPWQLVARTLATASHAKRPRLVHFGGGFGYPWERTGNVTPVTDPQGQRASLSPDGSIAVLVVEQMPLAPDRNSVVNRTRPDRKPIDDAIAGHMDALLLCYREAVKRGVTSEGTATVKLVIEGDGGVREASLKSSEIEDEVFEGGLVDELAAVRFPESSGGLRIVEYPLTFDRPEE